MLNPHRLHRFTNAAWDDSYHGATEMWEVGCQGTDSVDLVEDLPLLVRNSQLFCSLYGSPQLARPHLQIWQLVLLDEVPQDVGELRDGEKVRSASIHHSHILDFYGLSASSCSVDCHANWGVSSVHNIAIKFTLFYGLYMGFEKKLIKWGLSIILPVSHEEKALSLLRCGPRRCGCSRRADTSRWSVSGRGCSWDSRRSYSGCSPAPGSPGNAGPHWSP